MAEKRGKFVIVYGMNNSGKTTAARGVVKRLSDEGLSVDYVKYPIYDLAPTGPRINAYLRKNNPEGWSPEEAQRIYAQNRRDKQPQLLEELAGLDIRIGEDYRGTGFLWGLIYGVPLERLEKMNEDLLPEDLGILLDGERFSNGIEANHRHECGGDWERGRAIARDLARRYDWQIVNANQVRNKVVDDIVERIKLL